MDWYSVTIESEARASDVSGQLERWVEALLEGATTSWGGFADGPGATMSVQADDPIRAGEFALEVFEKALASAEIDGVDIARIDVMTEDYRDRWLSEPGPSYVGVTEIAEILGVSKQRVHELRRREDFPKPIADIAAGPVWTRDSLNHFMASWSRKPGRPAAEKSKT